MDVSSCICTSIHTPVDPVFAKATAYFVLDLALSYYVTHIQATEGGGREGVHCSLSHLSLLPFFPLHVCSQLHVNPEQRSAILRVLGQVHIDDTADEDIKGKEQFQVCILL